ncbi:MAG: site-2 protease family protein [Phycisphaerales bacterium]|nr:site-2 protease family protein [Phycisphaerales bacterium]
MDFGSLLNLLLLIFGFGFVIFWHELGHFLAAKWAGVKVEQFAIGFGHALLCWRKGIGLRVGTTRPEYERRAREQLASRQSPADAARPAALDEQQLDRAARELGLGETEYRLNWLPLGGYVKMLGQDDLNPNASSPDPRAYNNQPVGRRMVIVSAGVLMNVALAAILFVVLFLHGFRAPAPVVGYVTAGSPAQRAGLETGDRILRFNGEVMHDFTKLRLATALSHPAEPSSIRVRKPDGREIDLTLLPLPEATEGGFLQIGVGPPVLLEAPEELDTLPESERELPSMRLLRGGDRIVAVNGLRLPQDDSEEARDRAAAEFDRALQASGGQPLELTLRDRSGATRVVHLRPMIEPPFGNRAVTFAGMYPRVVIEHIQPQSSARGKLMPGDVVLRVSADTGTADFVDHPTRQQFMQTVNAASAAGTTISLDVLREGQTVSLRQLPLNVRIPSLGGIDRRGLGVMLSDELKEPFIAGIDPDSAAARAGLKPGMQVLSVGGKAVSSWLDVLAALRAAEPGQPVELRAASPAGEQVLALKLSPQEVDILAGLRFTHGLPLKERTWLRRTTNPFTAVAWGAGETRDLIVQFYVTLKRMIVQRSVSVSQMSGPLGILHSGTLIASRGTDWLLWYLAVISANLAVVNFLPIPIVDGGLFVFLVVEKLLGRPVSPKVMTATQLVGFALIISLFLFVTYNDILRLM